MASNDRYAERRQQPRTLVERTAKLQCLRSGKCYDGLTRDVSSGGAMFEIKCSSRFAGGQAVRVGIAWADRQVLLAGGEMVRATVLRSLGMADRQQVAIKFDSPQQLALCA